VTGNNGCWNYHQIAEYTQNHHNDTGDHGSRSDVGGQHVQRGSDVLRLDYWNNAETLRTPLHVMYFARISEIRAINAAGYTDTGVPENPSSALLPIAVV
jgi:hypothetical protein